MKLFIFILLMCLAGLAWVWPKKPAWKRTPVVPGRQVESKTASSPTSPRVYKTTFKVSRN